MSDPRKQILTNKRRNLNILRTLKESVTSFPTEFTSYRVLPSIISALEYGGASAVAILPLVLQFGKNVSPEEYPTVILAPLIKLFASPDRGTRMALLEHLPEFSEQLDKKMVAEQIWPHLVCRNPRINLQHCTNRPLQQTGFSDTVAVIREATIKSIILLSPKVSPAIVAHLPISNPPLSWVIEF
jgi:SCY1-like protein 1